MDEIVTTEDLLNFIYLLTFGEDDEVSHIIQAKMKAFRSIVK